MNCTANETSLPSGPPLAAHRLSVQRTFQIVAGEIDGRVVTDVVALVEGERTAGVATVRGDGGTQPARSGSSVTGSGWSTSRPDSAT